MKISEILRKAANEHLWDGARFRPGPGQEFSCIAVLDAEEVRCWFLSRAVGFLADLGAAHNSMTAFDEFCSGEQRQGARYAWLMFAAMVAEEEGL